MKKNEFISKLENALMRLDETDRKKVLKKYRTIFTRKLNSGMSEEEIINGFGNFNELIKSILISYGVDTPAQESMGIISSFFKEFLNLVEKIVLSLKQNNVKANVILIVEILTVILVISLFKFPVLLLRDLVASLLNYIINPFNLILNFIWRFFCELTYLFIAISLFVKINKILLKKRKKKYN